MGEDTCIAFGFNLEYRSDFPERWQEQGDTEDGIDATMIMAGKLNFLISSFPGLRMSDEQNRRYVKLEKQLL